MKILQLVTSRQYRGAEVFAANLSEELLILGHEIIFAGLYKNNKDVLVVENAANIDLAEVKTGFLSTSIIRKLIRLIDDHQPDVIQCNGSDTLKYMVAASLFVPRVPILYRNISMISNWVNTFPKKILYGKIFNRVAHVSSVGEEAVKDFISTFNYPPSQTSVIRRGIPITENILSKDSAILRSQMGFGENDKIVIHIGNFSPEKNHQFLMELFYKIKKENPNIKLLCVGDGILYEEVQKTIKEKRLEDSVFLLGFRRDVPELLAASDCFVLSSLVEGVPGVILEAASQKIPSVATNVGGVSEVLIDGETGYLIENFSQEDFKAKLMTLLLNDELRKSMGGNAYKLVYEEFNPKKNALKFENLYLKIKKENSH